MIRRALLQWDTHAVLLYGAILTAAIAIADWKIEINATLGFLYIFPMVLFGTVLGWWQVILGAAFCTGLADRLDPFPRAMEVPRDILIFLALATTGLLSLAGMKSYRRERKSFAAQRAAEEQLEFPIENSPAAVLNNDRGWRNSPC